MAERSAITQLVQVGTETTPGTFQAPTKKLQSMDFTMHPNFKVDEFRPTGYKFNTVLATQKEWTALDMKGQPTYTELIYPFSSLIKQVTPTTILDGLTDTTGRKWIFEPNSSVADTVATFTIEQGTSAKAQYTTYGLFTDMGMSFSRDKVDMKGKMIAQGFQENWGLTGGATSIPLVPITASQVTCFLDSTSAGLGTTKLGRLFSLDWELNNKAGPLWVIDASQASWVAHIELPIAGMLKMTLEADLAGTNVIALLRANTTYFLRILAQGPVVYAAGAYGATPLRFQYQHDFAVSFKNVQPFSDNQGVYSIGFDATIVHDATWGKATHCEIINKQTAL